jgi:hypothetical protein
LAGETEVLGEKLPQYHFVYHKSHMTRLGSKLGCRSGKPVTKSLSYGAALYNKIIMILYKLVRTQCANRAPHTLVVGSTNSVDRWI